VKDKDFSPLAEKNPELKTAAEEVLALFETENPSGAVIGEIFEKANIERQFALCKKNKTLKKLLAKKTDMTNILTTFRAGDYELAKSKYLPHGDLPTEKLENLLSENREKAETALKGTPYQAFVSLCLQAKDKGQPLTAAEKTLESFEIEYFHEKRFELKNKEPFLYYVLRRKTENANVRIVFVCKLAGLLEQDIKRRLRGV
jgi:vacuolar-type H+-ATPase subunit C/Vma6